MIINIKKEELKEYLNLRNDEEILEIKLKGINFIEDMSYKFSECEALESLFDISKWKTNHVINMSYMFYNFICLKFFYLFKKYIFRRPT